MYTQRLRLLLRAFRVSGQRGLVSLESLQSLPEPWIEHLKLVKGEVGSCQVRTKKDGQVLLSAEEALQWLENEEKLSWRLQEASQPILSPRFTAYIDGLHQQSIVHEPLNSALLFSCTCHLNGLHQYYVNFRHEGWLNYEAY